MVARATLIAGHWQWRRVMYACGAGVRGAAAHRNRSPVVLRVLEVVEQFRLLLREPAEEQPCSRANQLLNSEP